MDCKDTNFSAKKQVETVFFAKKWEKKLEDKMKVLNFAVSTNQISLNPNFYAS